MHAAAGEDGILVVSSLSAERNPCEGVGYLSDTFVHLNHKAGLVKSPAPTPASTSKHENLAFRSPLDLQSQHPKVAYKSRCMRPVYHGRVVIRKPPSCASRAWAFNFRVLIVGESGGNQ